jgi:Leucine-rich repeat (LRR) protein
MKNIRLINPENAIRILKDCNLTNDSDNLSVACEDDEIIIFNSNFYNSESFGNSLLIRFDCGGDYGLRPGYFTISLDQFPDTIEIELIELEFGIALRINEEIVYYKIRFKTFKDIVNLPDLRALDLTGWQDLENLDPINKLNKIESIKLTLGGEDEHDQFSFESLNFFKNLTCLNLLSNYSKKISVLSLLVNLEMFFLQFYGGWGEDENYQDNPFDLSFISGLINLKILEICNLRRISNVSFLNYLLNLQYLELYNPCGLKEFHLNNCLLALKTMKLNVPEKLLSIEFLKLMPNIENLYIEGGFVGCENLKDFSSISELNNLKNLTLDNLRNAQSFQSLNNCKHLRKLSIQGGQLKQIDIDFSNLVNLESLNLSHSNISNLGNIYTAKNLMKLDIVGCEKLVQLNSIEKMSSLYELDASISPNIRDIEKLSECKNLQILDIQDEVKSCQILMSCAYLRFDEKYIFENIETWIENAELSKESILYISRLLNCIGLVRLEERKMLLQRTCIAMRARGIQSESSNDLDAYTWETWCNLVLDLNANETFACFELAANELNIPRETEVILGPVIEAASEFIQKYPSEKEKTVQWVNEQLNQLESYPQETRQIAPSAAVFFASLNKKEEVLYWLQKATDEKAPIWRDRVLFSLVTYYARKNDFSESSRLLELMQIQEEKDKAIACLANAMATKYPIDAGFLLDEIKLTTISSATALNLLQQPAMLREPQGIYQLLLHLQSTPDELASTLEKLIEQDTEGKVAASLKQLFLTPQHSGPSAAVFLELCKHPTIGQFVKAWKLDEFINELQITCINEQKEQLSKFIDLLEQKKLIDSEEKPILIEKMKI